MKEKEEKKETQVRRKYAAKGEKSGKMCSFRLDWETVGILEHVSNKGRLINDLVQSWWRKQQTEMTQDGDANPMENDGHDVEP